MVVGEIPTFWPAQISLIPYQDIRVLALVVFEIILMHRPISKTVMSTNDTFLSCLLTFEYGQNNCWNQHQQVSLGKLRF